MKLAEALSVRADLQKKGEQLKSRMKDSAKTQEDDKPVEDVAALSQELDSVLDKLENLIFRINQTNMLADCDGENLTRLIYHP